MARWLDWWFRRGREEPAPTDSEELARLGERVVALYEQARYAEARSLAAELVERQRAVVGEIHPDYATALGNLGLLVRRDGDLDEAERLLRQSLEVRRLALGDRHPQFASNLAQVAELILARGDLDEAEPLLRAALDRLREVVGPRHPDFATTLTSLAMLLHRKGDIDAAEASLRETLAVRSEALGDDHPQVASALSNLAQLLVRRGTLDEAEPLLRRALDIRQATLGDQHPDTASSLSHLGHLLAARGDIGAELFLRSALSLRQTLLGPDHPDTQADAAMLASLAPSVADPAAPTATVSNNAPAAEPSPIEPLQNAATPVVSEPVTTPHLPTGPVELAAAASQLARTFSDLGTRLQAAAGVLLDRGLLPDASLIDEARRARGALDALDVEVDRRRAEVGETAATDPAGRDAPSLDRLRARVAALQEAHAARSHHAASRRLGLGRLSRIQGLLETEPRVGPLHEAVATLQQTFEQTPAGHPWPDTASRWLDGSHPLAAFARLAEADASLDDTSWLALYRTVAEAFGGAVAAAAARGRFAPGSRGAASSNGSPDPTIPSP